MKKLLAILLTLTFLIFPLASCYQGSESDTDPVTDTPVTDDPATDDPATDDPTTDNPTTDDPATDDPATDDPATDDPATDDPEIRENDEKLYVGYGRACLTPYDENGNLIPDIKLTGYAEERYAKTVKDDIYASCTAIRDDEENTALLFTLDLHAMTVEFAKTIAKTLERELGVPEENVILNVTHTHAAPDTGVIDDIVIEKVLEASRAALDDLTLVSALYTGVVKVDNMNFIRRYIEENGVPVAHISENDGNMPVVRFVRADGKKEVILANWAAHCDTVKGGNPTTISADYVGYFRKTIETDLNAYVSLHMAASGDVNPLGRLKNEPVFPGTSRYGTQLATNLINNLENLTRCEIKSSVAALTEKVKVSYDHSDDATHGPQAAEIMARYFGGEGLSAEVQALVKEYGFASIYDAMYTSARYKAGVSDRITVGAISIGNIVFAIAPYEMFTVNGVRIKASADEFDGAFMCAYSNGMIGYIASEEAFAYDIYEVQSRLYVKETATVLQDAIIEIIDTLGK